VSPLSTSRSCSFQCTSVCNITQALHEYKDHKPLRMQRCAWVALNNKRTANGCLFTETDCWAACRHHMLGHRQQPIPVTDVAGSCRGMPLQEWGGILVKLATTAHTLSKLCPSQLHILCMPATRSLHHTWCYPFIFPLKPLIHEKHMQCSCTHVHLGSIFWRRST